MGEKAKTLDHASIDVFLCLFDYMGLCPSATFQLDKWSTTRYIYECNNRPISNILPSPGLLQRHYILSSQSDEPKTMS